MTQPRIFIGFVGAVALSWAAIPAGAQTQRLDITAAPFTAPMPDWATGRPALAPTAPRLGSDLLGDGTPTRSTPRTASPTASVTIPGDGARSDPGGTAATVLADNIELRGDRTLLAAGGVVIWHQGARLIASRLRVDGRTGDLTIDGPIHLTRPGADPETDTILIADSAQLDRDMQDGILRGARLVIAREMQLAANEMQRTDGGRVTELRQVVASSCQICASDPTPLWEIRARRITHDAETRLLTFDYPQLRVRGLPVAAWPATVTAPDPTVTRKSGFLRPQIRTTSGLGFGVKLPWFQTMGDHADVTITPYLSFGGTRTVETRFRRAFAHGATEWNAAISRDDLKPGKTRGYVFGVGRFDLARDYRLGVQVQAASDRAYLLDYGITTADRLWSGVTLEQVRRDKMFWGRVGNYHSLRDDEDNDTSPAQVADAIWMRRITPPVIGGQAVLEWSVHAHRRPSSRDQIGRDVARGSVGLNWRRSDILPGGVVGAAIAGVDADLYRIAQDSRYDRVVGRVDPLIGAELRWPLAGSSQGATHLVEPVIQVLYSPRRSDTDIPNEDSRLIEFDEGNLFSANRMPGWDARETGFRANIGASWTRIDPTGWSLALTGGRVFRSAVADSFSDSAPLAGRRSDWLLAAHYDSPIGLAVSNRSLIDDHFDISRNELRLGWLRPGLELSAGHLWIRSDAGEGRDRNFSEFSANLGWQVAPGWWGTAATRYDAVADRAQRAELGLAYRNECITVESAVSRRFTSSDSVRPETSFDLSVRLGGFGASEPGPGTVARRRCMR
ncbi:LPS-assembly protein LptD [Paracoccus sp. (in: a-proteobacteria)]|uniref:LPS-assembly protein LptD n=1 Tax=Paracoccus sp. TaxID=267 RepID=UPI0026DF41B0|nr:LPS assembly protein LptD [Paracoccus sp. (in: a-proteobacteria)]MDO5648651.1 LPS assembly protein LptD [Paracoccus sp. (in: a-proteobacteria)]